MAFPGSFDPPTLAHVDLVIRGAALCETLVIGIGVNPAKSPLLTPAERADLWRTGHRTRYR